ncbi:MAG: hypothetical protein H7A32_02015 [Deltaproteobacteria bacterium]|nr:hypothetical protein [Deltaproteobacteria bacterium]
MNNFETRYDQLTVIPKLKVPDPEKKKKKSFKRYNRPYAPPYYEGKNQKEDEQIEEEEIVVAPEPIDQNSEWIEKERTQKKSGPSSLWMERVLQGGLAYAEVAQIATDIRLFKFAEGYSKQSILLMWNAESLLEMDGSDAVVSIQKLLDEFVIPEITQEKPKYYRGQDAFEIIQEVLDHMESFHDRFCAFSQGSNFFASKAHLEYSIDLLKMKLYSQSIVQSRKALSLLGSKRGEELDCNDVDQDKILIPFDLCPNSPEDRDGDEDEDGCPEFDVEFD